MQQTMEYAGSPGRAYDVASGPVQQGCSVRQTDSRCTHQAGKKHSEGEPEALGAHNICVGRHKTGVGGRGESVHDSHVEVSCHHGMTHQGHCVATHRPFGVLDEGRLRDQG